MGILWLVLLLFLGHSDAPRVVELQTMECESCKGSGTALQACLLCDGNGQVECQQCSQSLDASKLLERDLTTSQEDRARLVKSLRDTLSLKAKLFDAIGKEPRQGLIHCPASCKDGKLLFAPQDECKYCQGKGAFACAACKRKGFVGCPACKGRKRTTRACEDCLGSGKRTDPASIAPEDRASCPDCAGRGAWDCKECKQGKVDGPCPKCQGSGVTFCRKCLASGQRPCGKCSSSGKLKSFPGATVGNDCDKCKRKGRIACDECPGKPMACVECKGTGHGSRTCLACLAQPKRPCMGCVHGAFGSWERAADSLLARGEARAALAYTMLARGRVDGYFDRLAAEAVDPEASATPIQKSRREATRRLEARAEAAQAKLR